MFSCCDRFVIIASTSPIYDELITCVFIALLKKVLKTKGLRVDKYTVSQLYEKIDSCTFFLLYDPSSTQTFNDENCVFILHITSKRHA